MWPRSLNTKFYSVVTYNTNLKETKGGFIVTSSFIFLLISIRANTYALSIFRNFILLVSSDNDKSMLMRQKSVNKDSPIASH